MSKQIEPISIIIPTYNNTEQLIQCVNSIGLTRLTYPVDVIIVNNGHPKSLEHIGQEDYFRIIQTGGKNLGWEGGLIEGLKHTKSQFVMFMNDDTFIPPSEHNWIRRMIETFENPEVAAVGPCSNVVTGPQNMVYRTPHMQLQVSYLIGFCMILKRADLDAAGGVDETLPGGDDFDLSIRLRKLGKVLVARRDVYVHHHGFQTGARMHGGPTSRMGWNSKDRIERTNMALIKKHGFAEWFKCVAGYNYPGLQKGQDHEGDIIRQYIVGEKIIDLGCANNKTVPNAIGIDIVGKGIKIPLINGISESDITANVENDIPIADGSCDTVIARHLLEHCIDTIGTLELWKKKVKPGGRLIIAVPDESLHNTIPLNCEHVHAFTPETLNKIAMVLNLKRVDMKETNTGSFVSIYEKDGVCI